MTIRAVTWDAVGTLIGIAGSVGSIYAEVATSYGITIAPADLDARFHGAFQQVATRWGVPYGADEADARAFWDQVVRGTFPVPVPEALPGACYDVFAEARCWRVLPGVREALAAIAARGLPQAVVSNFDIRLPPLLRALGLGPFTAIITSASVGAAKPDPAPLQAAARALGVATDAILHIGDSAREDGGLSATGCRVLLVKDGIDLATLEAHW